VPVYIISEVFTSSATDNSNTNDTEKKRELHLGRTCQRFSQKTTPRSEEERLVPSVSRDPYNVMELEKNGNAHGKVMSGSVGASGREWLRHSSAK
jgi:hypothetical protein